MNTHSVTQSAAAHTRPAHHGSSKPAGSHQSQHAGGVNGKPHQSRTPTERRAQLQQELRAYREMLKDGRIENSAAPDVQQLRARIERRLAEIAQHTANPKGPNGDLSDRQQQRVQLLLHDVQNSIEKLQKLLQAPGTTPAQPNGSGGPSASSSATQTEPASQITEQPPLEIEPGTPNLGNVGEELDKTQEQINAYLAKSGDLSFMDQQKLQELMLKKQHLQSLLDQLVSSESTHEKSSHETAMTIIRNSA